MLEAVGNPPKKTAITNNTRILRKNRGRLVLLVFVLNIITFLMMNTPKLDIMIC